MYILSLIKQYIVIIEVKFLNLSFNLYLRHHHHYCLLYRCSDCTSDGSAQLRQMYATAVIRHYFNQSNVVFGSSANDDDVGMRDKAVLGVEVASGIRQATFAFFLEYTSWFVRR